MIGTRGVPAKYGGFETAIDEIGSRLVKMGHEIVVYCRGQDRSSEYMGMKRVTLPALRHPVLETLSHTGLSVAHLLAHRSDVALVFNAANALFLPALRAAGIPVAVHVDGLEWKRGKWGPNGRRYYLASERLAVAWADELIADAVGIQDYYRERYAAESLFIAYGAPIQLDCQVSRLVEIGLEPRGYHLVVARIEPENHVDLILEGYRRSNAQKPLVVVGSVPYTSAHERRVRELADVDPRVRLLGGIWDSSLLDALYAGSASYLHGHSVGGTNPSLLRAMGAGANVLAWDVNFNREVLADTGRFFDGPGQLAELLAATEDAPDEGRERGSRARHRAAIAYQWDNVAEEYERLCHDLLERTRSRQLRRSSAYAGSQA